MEKKKRTILVVDDDPDIVASIRMMLESEGYAVRAASDAAGCMEAVKEDPPDLILLDIMMERLTSGLHVGYALRSDPKTASIPIVMISAIGEVTGMHVAEEKDTDYIAADEFLEKPVSPAKLIPVVKRLLGEGE